MLLPTIMPHTLVAQAWPSEPTKNSTSATRMTRLRPHASASTPVTGLATSANRLVADVMSDLSSVVSERPDRSVPMLTRVLDITPVLRERHIS